MLGARRLLLALDGLGRGVLSARPQPDSGVTYATKIDRAEARLDWSRPAVEVWRKVRAFNPHPGAVTRLGEVEVKIWRATPAAASGSPGEVLEAGAGGIVVACGEASLRVEELQRAGGRRLSPKEFLSGHTVLPGEHFGN